MLNETYTLSNGVKIPKIGLGTWLIDNSNAAEAVKNAVKIGYRHIDTAQAYANEKGVGEGIRTCGADRDEIFLTTKVAAENKTYESAAASIDKSLASLGLDYIDLIIIHAPQPWAQFRDEKNRYFEENKHVWKALEDAYKLKKVRAIGVSNFLVDDLENLMCGCEIKPMVNQVLAHASNTPFEIMDFCKKNGILVEAYSPIAHSAALKNEKICAIAEKYGVSASQICLKYDIQLGAVVLPKTENYQHMIQNTQLDFTIDEADMTVLKNLEKIKDYGEHSFFPVFSKG